MKSFLWIALLDHSGSMGSGFEGKSGFSGFTETTFQDVKLEAAKDALIRQMRGFATEARVAVVAFNDNVQRIFQGDRLDEDLLKAKLEQINAEGGTDIGRALYAARSIRQEFHPDECWILLISDGLSDPARARAAAADCKSVGMRIDTILIDPTPAGIELAQQISDRFGGVVSKQELEQAVRESATAHEAPTQRRPFPHVAVSAMAISVLSILASLVAFQDKPTNLLRALVSLLFISTAGGFGYICFARDNPILIVTDRQHKPKPLWKYNLRLRLLCGLASALSVFLVCRLLFFTPLSPVIARTALKEQVIIDVPVMPVPVMVSLPLTQGNQRGGSSDQNVLFTNGTPLAVVLQRAGIAYVFNPTNDVFLYTSSDGTQVVAVVTKSNYVTRFVISNSIVPLRLQERVWWFLGQSTGSAHPIPQRER